MTLSQSEDPVAQTSLDEQEETKLYNFDSSQMIFTENEAKIGVEMEMGFNVSMNNSNNDCVAGQGLRRRLKGHISGTIRNSSHVPDRLQTSESTEFEFEHNKKCIEGIRENIIWTPSSDEKEDSEDMEGSPILTKTKITSLDIPQPLDDHTVQINPRTIQTQKSTLYTFSQNTYSGQALTTLSRIFLPKSHTHRSGSAFAGFLSLLCLTCANYVLSPMRDAAALAIGVSHIPHLTIASTLLAVGSSVPVGWLFEAPNPERGGRSWRGRVGLTRGETQGTSLALFLRCFAVVLMGYALTFSVMDWVGWSSDKTSEEEGSSLIGDGGLWSWIIEILSNLLAKCGKGFYIAFFLIVHLMKLHSLSLIWGVASEAMEYEEQAERRERRLRKKRADIRRNTQNGTVYNEVLLELHQNEICSVDEDEEDDVKGKGSTQNPNVPQIKKSKMSSVRLKRLAFVGFGGTLGGIIGSVFVSMTAQTLKLSGLLIIAAMLLELSAELSIEMGQIMLRHWEEEQMEGYSNEDLTSMVSTAAGSELSSQNTYDLGGESSIKRVSSLGGMKRVASGMSINSSNSNNDLASIDSSMKRVTSIGSMKRVASSQSISNMRRGAGSGASLNEMDSSMKRVSSIGSMKRVASGHSISTMRKVQGSGVNLNELDNEASKKTEGNGTGSVGEFTSTSFDVNQEEEVLVDDNTFKQRLLRGITTILRSRLLMTIFTYNALYATTTVLLSFQRAELVANRKSGQVNSVNSDTAFLAKINIASSLAVFALQASGLGALIGNSLGQRGTLALMPLVRFGGVALLTLSHARSGGKPPDLIFFLVMDEFTKVINFAIAKPVREGLWRGLSNEARYEAKPIVDTLANRWGGGSAAFLVALLDRIMTFTGVGEVLQDGTKQLLGFPPLLILCGGSAAWWTVVSLDLGNIRRNIDLELKKHQ